MITTNPPSMTLVGVSKDGTVSQRIQRLDAIFSLQSRWEKILKDCIDILQENVRVQVKKRHAEGWSAEKIVDDALETIIEAENKMIGRQSHSIVQSIYARYALNDPDEKAIFLALVREELAIN